jgi:hypothetical protein
MGFGTFSISRIPYLAASNLPELAIRDTLDAHRTFLLNQRGNLSIFDVPQALGIEGILLEPFSRFVDCGRAEKRANMVGPIECKLALRPR